MTTKERKHKFTAAELNTLDLVSAIMDMSGFPLTLEELFDIGEQFYGSDEPAKIKQAAEEARRQGLSMLDAVNRYYGLPRPPSDRN